MSQTRVSGDRRVPLSHPRPIFAPHLKSRKAKALQCPLNEHPRIPRSGQKAIAHEVVGHGLG